MAKKAVSKRKSKVTKTSKKAIPNWEKELNKSVFNVAKGFSAGFQKGMQF